MPHIEAADERGAWYAMGYEQARDALLLVQINVKRLAGQSLVYFGKANDPLYNVRWAYNDFIVQLFQTRPVNQTEAQLRTFFAASATSGLNASFYDMALAYVSGINAYRIQVKNAVSGTSAEARLHTWLATNSSPNGRSLTWVYDDPVDVIDVLSWGKWSKAHLSTAVGRGGEPAVNSLAGSGSLFVGGSTAPSTTGDLIPDPTKTDARPFFEEFKKKMAGYVGVGSNSFSWSFMHTKDPSNNQEWSCCVGDPHWPAQKLFMGMGGTFLDNVFNVFTTDTSITHSWYAHLKVTPAGASAPTLDALGEMQYGMGTFFVVHNSRVAYGGSLGSPNISDTFLLRLQTDTPAAGQPFRVYSYYNDTDGDDGQDASDWLDLVEQPITVGTGATAYTFKVWRAGRFGFVLPLYEIGDLNHFRIIYGEQTHDWRLTPNTPKNRFFGVAGTNPQTSPMVTTVRTPVDANVGGEPHQARFAVALWELAHANSIWDVANKFLDHDAGYMVNMAATDRDGRQFGIQAGTIPRRGNDAQLEAAGYHSFPEKFLAYSKGGMPVPARWKSDQQFDWVFQGGPTGPLQYLVPGGSGGPQFQPYIVFDPAAASFPAVSAVPFNTNAVFENPGFLSLSNEMLWHAWRDETFPVLKAVLPVPPTTMFNIYTVADNALLNATLEAGTVYSSGVFGFEAQMRNQTLTDRLTESFRRYVFGGTAGTAPMSPATARGVAVDARNYAPKRYTPPDGIGAGNPAYNTLPPAVRQPKEAVDNLSDSRSPRTEAANDARFLADLWAALYNGTWNNYAVPGFPGVTLKNVWIDNSRGNQIFWYDNPNVPSSVRWLDMPSGYGLIDFLWSRSDLSASSTSGTAPFVANDGNGGLTGSDVSQLTSVVADLVQWQTPVVPVDQRFVNSTTSTGATLLAMYYESFGATDAFGRSWLRLHDGQLPYYTGTGTNFAPPTSSGGLPAIPPAGNFSPELVKWEFFRFTAFPGALGSYLKQEGLNVPFSAIYVNGTPGGTLKSTLTPADINAIVTFFLSLSGDYIPPAHNAGNPSRKKARFDAWQAAHPTDAVSKFAATRPATYPLTRGQVRVAAMRRLMLTDSYLRGLQPPYNPTPGSIPQYGSIFRTRAFDYLGNQRWPAPGGIPDPSGAPCTGGFLRAVAFEPDTTASGYTAGAGFAPRYFGMGGSHVTLLTMLPKPAANGSAPPVESYFFCTPVIPIMGNATDPMYDRSMTGFANNNLVTTHYADYRTAAGTTGPTSLLYQW